MSGRTRPLSCGSRRRVFREPALPNPIAATLAAMFLGLAFLIGCGGGEGGGGVFQGATPENLSIAGTVSFEAGTSPTMGRMRPKSQDGVVLEGASAAVCEYPSISLSLQVSSLGVSLLDSSGNLAAGPVPTDGFGRFLISGVPPGFSGEIVVLDPGDRTILLATLENLRQSREGIIVGPLSTAVSTIFRTASDAIGLSSLELKIGGESAAIASMTVEIRRWIEGGTAGNVADALIATFGRDILRGLGGPFPPVATHSGPVTLVEPLQGAVFEAGSDVRLLASASPDGLRKVEFFQNGFKIGESAQAPFGFTWAAVPSGTYTLVAKAVRTDWSRTTSAGVSIRVSPPPNHPPLQAVIVEPASGARGVFGSVTLRTGIFSDPDPGDYHLKTDWEVSTDSGFSPGGIVRSIHGVAGMEASAIVTGLATGTTFWARARHCDNLGGVGSWSEPSPFRTMAFSPAIEWGRCYGGSDEDVPGESLLMRDGRLVVAGTSRSGDGQVARNEGGLDAWVICLDSFGGIRWKRVFGGVGADRPVGLVETSSGTCLVLFSSDSPDGDFACFGNDGQPRMGKRTLVAEILPDGTTGTSFFLFPPLLDSPGGLLTDSQGKTIVAGNTRFRDDGFEADSAYAAILQIDPGPSIGASWRGKDWRGTLLARVHPWGDPGGFTVLGIRGEVSSGTVMGWAILAAIRADGTMGWRQTITDQSVSLNLANPANFAVKSAVADDGGVLVTYPSGLNAIAMKLDASAKEIWRKTLLFFRPGSLCQKTDGSALLAGIAPPPSGEHGWCHMKGVDPSGGAIGNRNFGGNQGAVEYVSGVLPTPDNGFFTVCYSESTGGDVSGNHGGGDFWVVKWSNPDR